MKKIINIAECASVLCIAMTMALTAIWAGANVCNYLADTLGIAGQWTVLCLLPVMLVVTFGVTGFFLMGVRRLGQGMCQ